MDFITASDLGSHPEFGLEGLFSLGPFHGNFLMLTAFPLRGTSSSQVWVSGLRALMGLFRWFFGVSLASPLTARSLRGGGSWPGFDPGGPGNRVPPAYVYKLSIQVLLAELAELSK